MSRNYKRGNAGVTILVIVIVLIIAGILYFVNRKGDTTMVNVNGGTTTVATGTMPNTLHPLNPAATGTMVSTSSMKTSTSSPKMGTTTTTVRSTTTTTGTMSL